MSYKEIYDSLRKKAEEAIDNKRNGKIRVVLNYSMCSVSVGANEVLKALQEVVAEGQFDDVIIETTGCAGLCSKEPILDVYMPDGERYTYEFVTPKKARAIVVSHTMYDEHIDKWLLKM
ncbi:(2Fe-2S) ferredoxin domain-containing protein [Paramaledivibacter caminithermalis]|jgi:NADP-reducing hydrogenase subunit HndB|uniref:NADP-reducing hydrogenase subunit HndB n=1 Tax=Paramaledivibacter caminithermalis (strain DSM 15212 / CIP 107654 / DViRD3) TaxID=1121301 RepID=A0A1M6PUI4_PARC5|nr:(2Fe-2S) ferredoxin domain-containing protein [Paramaledivibacter caminithermalis]SHK11510.1 NADP-reducing hydrogenase subunit HndB [Paramaledivibacter caminithermalis DSM 15212]